MKSRLGAVSAPASARHRGRLAGVMLVAVLVAGCSDADSSGIDVPDAELFGQETLDALDHYKGLAERLEDSDDAVLDITGLYDLIEEVAAAAEDAGRHADASDLRDRRQQLELPEATDFGSLQAVPMVEIEGAVLAGRGAVVADQIGMSVEAARLRDMGSRLSRPGFVREAWAARDEFASYVSRATTIEEVAEMGALEAGFFVQTAEALEEFGFLNDAALMYLIAAELYGLGAVVEGASNLDDDDQADRYAGASDRASQLGMPGLSELLTTVARDG